MSGKFKLNKHTKVLMIINCSLFLDYYEKGVIILGCYNDIILDKEPFYNIPLEAIECSTLFHDIPTQSFMFSHQINNRRIKFIKTCFQFCFKARGENK